MNDITRDRVQAIQVSMVGSSQSCFSESEQDHLRCLIRLTVEFDDLLQNRAFTLRGKAKRDQDFHKDILRRFDKVDKLKYSIESIFSGIESFLSLNAAYSVLEGSEKSKMNWRSVSKTQLEKNFILLFRAFVEEPVFENKCRLLLDLFKLQIVFAGILYD